MATVAVQVLKPAESERLRYQQNLAQDMRKVNAFDRQQVSHMTNGTGTEQKTEILEQSMTTKEGSCGVSNHYEVPNLSSMLYEFTNREQDRVNHCFRIGNFLSLRDLPTHILPGNVSQMNQSKINENLYSQKEERTYIELQKGGGYFSKFEYRFYDDSYENLLEKLGTQRVNSCVKFKNENDGKIPFNNMPSQEIRLKHQRVFWSKDDQAIQYGKPRKANYQHEISADGFISENDPYEANAFEVLRSKWIQDSKKLYGDFIQSTGNQSMRKFNRMHLPEAVGYIKRRLLADWNDVTFIIGTNPEDYIELRFLASSQDAPLGLKAYMNTLVDQDEQLTKYQLRRVSQFWGISTNQKTQPVHYVYYMLAPPWARHREPILYLQQLPVQDESHNTSVDN